MEVSVMLIENADISVHRRDVVCGGAFGTIAVSLIGGSQTARAETYGPSDGKEVAPGVRVVELGTGDAIIPGYKSVSLIDVVFQPRSNLPSDTMANAMICHVTEGELRIVQDGKEFQAKKNHLWTCAKGTKEGAWNEGSVVAVMRITNLLPA
jgi:hypothetical protein